MPDDHIKPEIQLREFQRLAVAFALTYVIDDSQTVRFGRARDISGGGIHFESNERVPEGAVIGLGFELSRGAKLELQGKVMSSEFDAAHGVHQNRIAFENVCDEVRQSIRGFVFEALRTALLAKMLGEKPKSDLHVREYQRLNVTFSLTYSIDGAAGVHTGRARDISDGGIHFESREHIPEAADVGMSFELPNGSRIEVLGKVLSSRLDPASNLFGNRLAFESLPACVADSIHAFVYEALRRALVDSTCRQGPA
jgi:hypothetical protein